MFFILNMINGQYGRIELGRGALTNLIQQYTLGDVSRARSEDTAFGDTIDS
jgi:hypothetical protein